VASGVTVHEKWIVDVCSQSQGAGNTGKTLEGSSPFSQRFAGLFRPLGTSLVQSRSDGECVRWVSVREFAGILRVSTSTVYQAVAAGLIPHVRVSNAIRIATRQ
jgi:excisionase family DNA binding protein